MDRQLSTYVAQEKQLPQECKIVALPNRRERHQRQNLLCASSEVWVAECVAEHSKASFRLTSLAVALPHEGSAISSMRVKCRIPLASVPRTVHALAIEHAPPGLRRRATRSAISFANSSFGLDTLKSPRYESGPPAGTEQKRIMKTGKRVDTLPIPIFKAAETSVTTAKGELAEW